MIHEPKPSTVRISVIHDPKLCEEQHDPKPCEEHLIQSPVKNNTIQSPVKNSVIQSPVKNNTTQSPVKNSVIHDPKPCVDLLPARPNRSAVRASESRRKDASVQSN